MITIAKAMDIRTSKCEYANFMDEIDGMLDEAEPSYQKIFERCEAAIETFRVEFALREENGTLAGFSEKVEESISGIYFHAGITAFELCQDDISYMERAEDYLISLPQVSYPSAHLTLAKIYLYKEIYDLALLHMEYHVDMLEVSSWVGNMNDTMIQMHREASCMGFAAIYYARDEYEYFYLYIGLIKSNNGIPEDKYLMVLNFVSYFELNADNILFLQRLFPLCPYMEEALGVRYDLWIKSELAYRENDFSAACELAEKFKESHKTFLEVRGGTFEEGWNDLANPEDDESDWPSDNLLHPAMGNYVQVPIAKRVDDRLVALYGQLENNQINATGLSD